MAFVKQISRLFTETNVKLLKTGQIGVYGIFKEGQWIYIGKGDIRQRLIDHLNGDIPAILRNDPTHWVAELTGEDPSVREKELILECNPLCNQRIG